MKILRDSQVLKEVDTRSKKFGLRLLYVMCFHDKHIIIKEVFGHQLLMDTFRFISSFKSLKNIIKMALTLLVGKCCCRIAVQRFINRKGISLHQYGTVWYIVIQSFVGWNLAFREGNERPGIKHREIKDVPSQFEKNPRLIIVVVRCGFCFTRPLSQWVLPKCLFLHCPRRKISMKSEISEGSIN